MSKQNKLNLVSFMGLCVFLILALGSDDSPKSIKETQFRNFYKFDENAVRAWVEANGILIQNSSSLDWTSLSIEINPPIGYLYPSDKTHRNNLRSGGTLRIPYKDFVSRFHKERFDIDKYKPSSIEIEVSVAYADTTFSCSRSISF